MNAAARVVSIVAVLAASLSCSQPRAPSRAGASIAPPDPAAIFGGPAPARAQLVFETDAGDIRCAIDPARVPRAAAMVVGLARGDVRFRDARSGAVVQRRYYDGLTFFRRLPGEMVQTGCPLGDGTGTPGFRIPLETGARDAELLAGPGALLLAHYQPPPLRADPAPPAPDDVIGSQLVVALAPMTQNRGAVTVLGRCGDLDVVRRISTVPRSAPAPVLRALRASW